MELIHAAIDLFLHLDKHLNDFAGQLGPWLYLVLFGIVFCETGLVVTPFLPGDSLLFAAGALSAIEGSPIRLELLWVVMCVAAVLGDAVNYSIGRYLGPKVFTKEDSMWLNKKHLLRTQEFYEEHGGKTIILARFVPIIRTFAPFVAGIGKMEYPRFASFNVVGGILWVTICLGAGRLFGNIPVVKANFELVILGIIGVSMLPLVLEYIRAKRNPRPATEPAPSAAPTAD